MPYKKEYSSKTMGGGLSRSQSSVQGSQGSGVKIPVSHFQPKPTKHTDFSNMFTHKGKVVPKNNHA